MDQNRADSSHQPQNVHVYMHQVLCGCHGSVYHPPPYYHHPMNYRHQTAPIMAYGHQAMARPIMHQYHQYTQYNQYSMPPVASVVSTAIQHTPNPVDAVTIEPVIVSDDKESKDETSDTSTEKLGNDSTGGGHISPPPTNEILSSQPFEKSAENFIKFLERSCTTAEQIAYRNRNRPCFRNIQHLCDRTRGEVAKPSSTVSNIHSQGIPWATKDFIYAFVRLVNCWHILSGYWEHRDDTVIGYITKEFTPEFRESYVRWEKETIEMTAHLSKVFFNLDNDVKRLQNVGNIQVSPNGIIPTAQKQQQTERKKSNEVGATPKDKEPKKKAVDRGNQTYFNPDYNDSFENGAVVDDIYMKPGSYDVPSRSQYNTRNNYRTFEFFDSAQNAEKSIWGTSPAGDCPTDIFGEPDATWAILGPEADRARQFSASQAIGVKTSHVSITNSVSDQMLFNGIIGVEHQTDKLEKEPIACSTPRRWSDCGDDSTLDCERNRMRTDEMTDKILNILERVIEDLKKTEFSDLMYQIKKDNRPNANLDLILHNLKKRRYKQINEVMRDLYCVIKRTSIYYANFVDIPAKVQMFIRQIQSTLDTKFGIFDYWAVKIVKEELLKPLRLKCQIDSYGE